MKNITKFNFFIFFTIFAKSLVEIFFSLLLFNMGYDIKKIILFFLIVYGLNIINSLLINKLSKYILFNILIFSSGFLFVTMYLYLNTYQNIFIIAFLYSLNNILYYLGRHIYAESVLEYKSIARGVGKMIIVTILATIPASFIGPILITNSNIYFNSILILILFIIGVIPLFKLKYDTHKHDKIINLIKNIPVSNLIYFMFSQFKILFLLLYPLYIYLNVKTEFTYIGLLNAIVGITSIIFIYFYSKKMDKNNKDYMLLSSTLLGVIMLVQINIKVASILFFTSIIEGIASKLYETSNSRDFYYVDKKMDKKCYFLVQELINDFFKIVVLTIFYLSNISFYWILTILGIGIIISGFIKFKIPNSV